jgi:catechol 2,3-dioxygenase-like lactoylglutathione lyase family enzyme
VKPTNLVPMMHVADCRRSMAFYDKLGFETAHKLEIDGRIEWAWLDSRAVPASLMIARAEKPVDAKAQAVLFYVYVADVAAAHADLVAAGVTVGPIEKPPYSPKGEFRLEDPDGYTLFVTHEE